MDQPEDSFFIEKFPVMNYKQRFAEDSRKGSKE